MTTMTEPLMSEQERTILYHEATRKEWRLDIVVHYTEREVAQLVNGDRIHRPEWQIEVGAERIHEGKRITATITAVDPDDARYMARSFVEGLPEKANL